MGAVPEVHSEPFGSPCKGYLSLQMQHIKIYIWCLRKTENMVNVFICCLKDTRNIHQTLILNLAGPCREELLPVTPQSRRETSSYTCRGHNIWYNLPYFCSRYDDDRGVNASTYLWHNCPMPSKGWRTPVEDSPCARKKTTGLYFDNACPKKI